MRHLLLAALLLPACGGSFEEARNPKVEFGAAPQSPRCDSLDSGHRDWSASAKLSSILAAGLGGSLLPEQVRDNDIAAVSVAGGALAAAGWAGFSMIEADGFATAWARECSK